MEPRAVSRETTWIEWTRTRLTPPEVERELASLSSSETARLQSDGWLWIPARVLWIDPSGALRRARFTHGTHFETAKGDSYVDSAGNVEHRPEEPARA